MALIPSDSALIGTNPASASRNTDRAQIGVEEELVGIRTAKADGQMPGEVVPDMGPYLRRISDSGAKSGSSATREVVRSVVEQQIAPTLPRDLDSRLITMRESGQESLANDEIVLAPLATVLLLPLLGRNPMRPNVIRGFSMSNDPYYKAYIARVATPEQYDDLGVCSMHVHVSLDGRLNDERALRITQRLRPFLPWLLALSGSSTANSNGIFRGFGSVRWLKWANLRTSTHDELGTTRSEYENRLKRLVELAEMDPKDPSASRRIFAPIRPNFEYGTVEVRVCDVQSSATARRLIPRLIAGLVQAVDQPDCTLPIAPIGSEALRFALRSAAESGMHPRTGKLFHPQTGGMEPLTRINADILRILRPVLMEQGVWTEVDQDFRSLLTYGTGADRQKSDMVQIHELFKRAGVRSSRYDFRFVLDGQRPISHDEARASQLSIAAGALLELSAAGNAKRQQTRVEVAEKMIAEDLNRQANAYQPMPRLAPEGRNGLL